MARYFERFAPVRLTERSRSHRKTMQELVLIQPSGTLGKESAREAQADASREFEARIAECGPLAYRVARGVLRNSADAEDVAQEALLRAYRSFDRLRDRTASVPGSFVSRFVSRWTACARPNGGATRRALVAARASAAHRYRRGPGGFERISSAPRSRLEELPEKLRLALLLAAMEGHTIDEIASLLGIPVAR